jgi:hypothetical protein
MYYLEIPVSQKESRQPQIKNTQRGDFQDGG